MEDDVPFLTTIQSGGWPMLLAAAFGAIVLGLLAQPVAWWLLRKATNRFSSAELLLTESAAPARYIFPLFLLQFVWLAGGDSEAIELLAHLTRVLLIASLTWLLIRLISAATGIVTAAQPIGSADNLAARRVLTQAMVISRSLKTLAVILGIALALLTFPGARALGTSLLASAGLAGIIAGLAARPVLSNLIAGMQIALSQPFRIDDVLIVQGEWGRVEEITSTYVSLRIWDERRLIIPLQWFIENAFENWTRQGSDLIGTVVWWVDFRMPMEPLRQELQKICEASEEWDGKLSAMSVVNVSEKSMQMRALVTARNSGDAWTLRCKVREAMIAYMQEHYEDYLPRERNEIRLDSSSAYGDDERRKDGDPNRPMGSRA